MPEKKGARLDFDERWEIEDMLKESSPFREIARKLGVSPTTVSSEVKLNRAFFKPKAMQSARRSSARSAESATYCTFEKVLYVASRAQAAHDARLRGLCRHRLRTELKDMVGKVKGLLAQGQSI